MTTREDLTVTYNTSPRVAEVDAPSTEIIMQDLVDTLRKDEDAFSKGLAFQKLLNASGKDDLGGGIFVGITVALQDTLLAFEGRTTPAETGTVTTGSGAPIIGTITFEDSNANFVAANVARGSLVVNFTDQSVADVVEVVDATTLITKILVNGVGNTFDFDDVYHVFNIIQVNATGGNLVAVDDLGNPISAILPTAFTQVILTASSSATLQEQQDIQFSSFNGGITVDVVAGVAGTAFPTGTLRQPVNNMVDAIAIANNNGLFTFFIIGDITLDTGDVLTNAIVKGQTPTLSTITINPGAVTTNVQLFNAHVSGTLDGGAMIVNCHIGTLVLLYGDIINCLLDSGVITLGGGILTTILDCWDGTAGLSQPIIDMGGSGQELVIRNYSGGLEIRNKTGVESVSISLDSGRIVINDNIIDGEIVLRGVGRWDNKDTYVGGANVIDEMVDGVQINEILDDTTQISIDSATILDFATTLLKFQKNRNKVDQTAKTLTIYDDDGTTPIHVFDLTDFSGTPSVTEIAERVPQ